MAEEIVNLASFDFDTSKLESSLDSLQTRMFELKKENQLYSEQLKVVAKESNNLVKELVNMTDEGKKNTEEYKKKEAQLKKSLEVEKEMFKSQQNVAISISRVSQELKATTNQIKAYTDAEGKKIDLGKSADAAIQREIKSINDARASNTELLRVRNQLNPAIAEEAKIITELNERLDSNNAYIKENASAYEQQKINIGNYSESIKTAFSDMNIFNGGLSGFIERSKEAGGAGNLVKNSLGGMAQGFLGVAKAGLAFIATPIGAFITALVTVFGLIKNAMNRSEEATNSISKIFSVFSGVLNKFFDIISPIGEYLINSYVKIIEKVGEQTEKAMKLISDGLRFLGFDDAANSVDNFTASTKASIKQAQELADAEKELEKETRKARLTQLEYQKEAEKLRQIRDNDALSTERRIKANEELGLVLQRQLKEELRIADVALKVANLRIAQSGKTKENLDAQADALTQIADIQERITGQESEQLTNINSLRKEANDKAIAQNKARQEAALKAMQTELDFYIESQGIRKKSMQEQLALDREIMDRELAIAKANFEAKKTNRKEYELSILEIQNEFAKKQVDATVENAKIELDLFIENNQRKIEANQFFSDELFNQELERINRIAEAEANAQTIAFQNGVINAEEYGRAIAKIDESQRLANETATAEREQAKKDQNLADQAIQDELNAERFEFDLALQMERYEREYAERKAIAEKNGADMIAFEQNEANKKKLIEETVQSNKLELASQTLGNLISLAGKESALGKALAIAQTTIDTYQSATAAYKALAGIPVVGPALGVIAAGTAVKSGLDNVKKIVAVKDTPSQKVPGYRLGGRISDGVPIGSTTGDNVYIRAKLGEAMLNDQQINNIGTANLARAGVPGFSASGSTFVQNNLDQNANNAMMATMISEAVMVGAERGTASGSERGLVGLSDNRQIMENAKF